MTGTSPIGAVIAMEVELQHLLARGHIKQESKHGPWREVRMQIGEREVIAVLCGVGMVNAAAATEYLIGAHQPRIIVNSGCTGAHVAELMPGDVIIGTSVIYHAATQILATGEERYTGFSFETITREIKSPALPTDPGLVDIAQRVAETTRMPDWPADLDWPASQPRRSPHVVSGQSPQRISGRNRSHVSISCASGMKRSAKIWKPPPSARSPPATRFPI